MDRTPKPDRRHDDTTPRDKPRSDRGEHANLQRPGARAHPRAATDDWAAAGWRID